MKIREGVQLGYARLGMRCPTIHNSSIVEHPAGNGAVAGLIGRRKLEAYYLLFFFRNFYTSNYERKGGKTNENYRWNHEGCQEYE